MPDAKVMPMWNSPTTKRWRCGRKTPRTCRDSRVPKIKRDTVLLSFFFQKKLYESCQIVVVRDVDDSFFSFFVGGMVGAHLITWEIIRQNRSFLLWKDEAGIWEIVAITPKWRKWVVKSLQVDLDHPRHPRVRSVPSSYDSVWMMTPNLIAFINQLGSFVLGEPPPNIWHFR